MEPIPTPSTDAPVQPTITYVGRLSDRRKGLELFLDALELLWSVPTTAKAAAWIIGGDASEARLACSSALARAQLQQRVEMGKVVFWGRIDHAALPEFYSRSTVVVVPSFREQFGMVAVEAMMCGCPVVAARVGGLCDVVVHGRTGVLFERGNAAALAACLGSYVACPALSAWQGENASFWARDRFELRNVLPALEALLDSREPAPTYDYDEEAERVFLEQSIGVLTQTAERLLGRMAVHRRDLTSSQSVSFRLDLDDGERVFVKQYSRRPTFLYSIHGDRATPPVPDTATYRLSLLAALGEQKYLPEVLCTESESGLVVQRWIDITHEVAPAEAGAVVRSLAAEVAATKLLSLERLIAFTQKTAPLAGCDLLELPLDQRRMFDRCVAELQSPLHDGVVACRRLHPQIELARIADYLANHRAWLPGTYSVRAMSEIRRLLRVRGFLPQQPVFAHGSLKNEHILTASDRSYLCDFDHAGYYAGPMDLAHWIWHCWEHNQLAPIGARPDEVLCDYLSSEADLYLAACWLLAFRLNKDLVHLTRGDWGILASSMEMLWQFGASAARLQLLG